jgi:hypothetical protein
MKLKNKFSHAEMTDTESKILFKIGGLAALLAGGIFRRNLAAEVVLFAEETAPVTVSDWFALLQSNRLLGLTYLNFFDVVNYALVSLMLLALYAVLKKTNKSYMSIAMLPGFLGIAVYFASNTAFSMLSLSDQYVTAATDTERSMLLSAGEAMLAINRFTSQGAHPGTGGYLSLLLIAISGLITSVVMLRSNAFHRVIAYVGILASVFDLAYCIAYVFAPTVDSELLAVIFIPAGGLFLMVWHILVGWRLYQLGK